MLRRGRIRATASVVTFTDINGPKGGEDIRCAVTVEAPGRPAQHAGAPAADARLALDGALQALERELLRDRGKRRDLARRPKKYFVADLGTRPEGEAALPAVRRRRRVTVNGLTHLTELAKLPAAEKPVVSVYLNTRWTDESQRERVRIFLKNHLREARTAVDPRPSDKDLDWIEAQGQRLVAGDLLPEARGVVLFAGGDGLREVVPVRAAFDDAFVVNARPHLRPLAGVIEEIVPALVVFVDGVHARLVSLAPAGSREEVTLRSDVEGRHAATGWADRAQTRFQRHIEEHRGRHYEAVAQAVEELAQRHGVRRIVLSGEARAVGLFRDHLSTELDRRVVGVVSAAGHEPMATIAERAAEHLARVDEQEDSEAVDRLLDAAAKRGRAVTGLEPTLEAVNRNAVQQLYLLPGFGSTGAICEGCSALQPPALSGRCRFCGDAAQPTELGEAMVGRVLASGGTVGVIDRHAELNATGGVGAILRYAA